MTTKSSDYHDKGQTDRAEGKSYDAPHGLVEDLLTWSREGCQRMAEDNSAYRDGWNHTDSQLKK